MKAQRRQRHHTSQSEIVREPTRKLYHTSQLDQDKCVLGQEVVAESMREPHCLESTSRGRAARPAGLDNLRPVVIYVEAGEDHRTEA